MVPNEIFMFFMDAWAAPSLLILRVIWAIGRLRAPLIPDPYCKFIGFMYVGRRLAQE